MPANLPPNYYSAERRLREESDPSKKVTILREMLAIMPKHKGTEHLQGELKKKISKLNIHSQKKKGGVRSAGLDYIPREGAGQVVFAGLPNSGKSSILNFFTNANSNVESYPFSTFKPVQGMMQYEDINIQLIDLPPVSEEFIEQYTLNIFRLSDIILLVIDLSNDNLFQDLRRLQDLLNEHNIFLKIDGESSPRGVKAFKSAVIVGTKIDLMDNSHIHIFEKEIKGILPYVFLSVDKKTNTNIFKQLVFKRLKIIRVYTKTPGQKENFGKPYILPIGATVIDAAEAIHKDLAKNMKYARIWSSKKYNGQRVDREYLLNDGDIIEIHKK